MPGRRESPAGPVRAMGQEVDRSHFYQKDFRAFEERLGEETALLKSWFDRGAFDSQAGLIGFELEAWLMDREARPCPQNVAFLEALNDPMVVPELAQFNIELNSTPCTTGGDFLSRLYQELTTTLQKTRAAAKDFDAEVILTGILPTVRNEELTLENMSRMVRYRALNEQIMRMRRGLPLTLDIQGEEKLLAVHKDVMLEAAATSLQIHLQVSGSDAVRFYNASKITSGPQVALAANSPFLCGRNLWAETRIPLFEQAVAVHDGREMDPGSKRVTFGAGYISESLFECFEQNQARYGVLLPILFEDAPEHMRHVALHNGTIWRWNRPLVGGNGLKPHLRIENRVCAAGPTPGDVIANMAFYVGLVHELALRAEPPEAKLSFEKARRNFYEAARRGLEAELFWLDGRRHRAAALLPQLIELSHTGLSRLNVHANDIDHFLGTVRARVEKHQNGALWQRGYAQKCGGDMVRLTRAYSERATDGEPVHTWNLE